MATAKKSASKQSSANKSAAKESPAKTAAKKSSPAKKTSAKKTSAKRSSSVKPSTSPAKKTAPGKTESRKISPTAAKGKKESLVKQKRSTGSGPCWPGFERVPGKEAGTKGSCKPKPNQTAAERKEDAREAAGAKLRKAGGNKAQANRSR